MADWRLVGSAYSQSDSFLSDVNHLNLTLEAQTGLIEQPGILMQGGVANGTLAIRLQRKRSATEELVNAELKSSVSIALSVLKPLLWLSSRAVPADVALR